MAEVLPESSIFRETGVGGAQKVQIRIFSFENPYRYIFWGRLESEHVLLELAKTRDKRMMEGEGFEGLGFNMVVF